MSETTNDNTEIELENEYQSRGDIMFLIKEQTSGITIKKQDIENLTRVLKEWNDCYLFKKEPKIELKEIKIDDFTLSYKEFKSLLDNGLLSNQYYISNFRHLSALGGTISRINDSDILEANLDMMMPSMSKDGIFNMMNYSLAKHSSVSNEVELHYASANEGDLSIKIGNFRNLINNEIIERSKMDGKAHFVLTDTSKTEDKIISGHITPYIVINGEVFEFDSTSSLGIGSGYHTVYLQQTDGTSCKTIAIREVDNFLKILENFDSIEEFSSYLKQFFSENKVEYYIDSDNLNGDLIEGPKKDRRLAVLPFPILKNSQSLSSLKKTLEFIKNLEKKHRSLPEAEKERFINKHKHILEMKYKLDKLINRFEVEKKIFNLESRKIRENYINAYTLKERLRQAKTLAILLEKGKTKSLGEVEEYRRSSECDKVAVATVDKNWIREINNRTEDNIKNREIRILENNELEKEREKTKSTITYKVLNFFSKIFTGKETNYKTEQEILLEKKNLINRIIREQFRTVSNSTEQRISDQNESRRQNIRNELNNDISIENERQRV